jgi:hypothetical protein
MLVAWVRRVLGALAIAMILAAVGQAFAPLEQASRRCGAPAAFLAEGRVDRPDEPPCRDAAADRIATALVLVGGSVVTGVGWAAVADRTAPLRRRTTAA